MDSIRKEFEEAMKIPEGIYYSAHHKAYRSVNGRIYEQGQACDANLQLEGWVKSRESLVIELPASYRSAGSKFELLNKQHMIDALTELGICTK